MSTLTSCNSAASTGTLSQKLLRAIAACILLAIGAGILAAVTSQQGIANRDFIEYWAAGRQLIHGGNPYDEKLISITEQSAGMHGPGAIIMFNPPSALFMTLPLGVLSPRMAYLLWSLFVLGAWLGSVRILWIINGCPRNSLHFIGYFFAPAFACFFLGQTSPFVLLGLALFLNFHRTRPFLAGAALLLCTLKPHLLLPFAIVLLAWAFTQRAYRLLAGAACALAISCAVPLIFDPSIYTQYAAMAHTSDAGVRAAFIPTLSQLLRLAINPHAFWLQFLPAFAGCIWALWYFHRHRNHWDWRLHGSLLILVSVVVAPYAWFFDATVLLPSLYYAAYRARPAALTILFGLFAVGWIQLLLNMSSKSAWYLWPAVAWLAWYLWSMKSGRGSMNLPQMPLSSNPDPYARVPRAGSEFQ